jgi:uncharacterized protein (DUF362 family)
MKKKNEYLINRRHMLKRLGFGSMACLLTGYTSLSAATPLAGLTYQGIRSNLKIAGDQCRVSVVKGSDCRDNTFAALKNIEDQILASLEGKKRILVKPNFVVTNVPLCATHVDSVRGILDFLRPRWKGPIVVGESTVSKTGTMEGFKNYGYLPLEKEYGIKLCDLNEQPYVNRFVLGPDNVPQPVRIISTFLDKDQFIVSAAKMKTHDLVLVTLSLKNILLAAPFNDYTHNDKRNMHINSERSKNSILHYNMFTLAQEIYPDLGVIDGFEAMEGNGPVGGTPVDARVALASIDSLALDTVATKIMGFDPTEILYFSSMHKAGMGQGDLDKINIIGTGLQDVQYQFKPHTAMVEPYGLG